uniref:Uncharacterized protein n=1 Tax=Alexandrium monilatum TaxID=311494 RepID=A0A7S4W2Z6_9DINO
MTNVPQLGGGRTAMVSPAGAVRHVFVFIAAGHLAASTGTAADEAHRGLEEDSVQLGLFRNYLRGSSRARDLLGQDDEFLLGASGLLVPQANDTISEEYWARVNRLINQAGQLTPPPVTLNDPLSTPAPEPWRKIMSASDHVDVLDASQAQKVLSDWEYATPQPFDTPIQLDDQAVKPLNVVPYDMQIGANIMSDLTPKNTPTPPPSQAYVDESFVAQCPMVMFKGALAITPPRCTSGLGSWTDAQTNRPMMRWSGDGNGGIGFGVDSVVSGEGSVSFAEFRERFSLTQNLFDLANCMNVRRYTIQEKIIKVDHMAPLARSTAREHDLSQSSEAYFYQYVMKHVNGSTVGSTNLYRMDQSEVNFTLDNGELADGQVFAVARRQGFWRRDEWRDCHHPKRAWVIDFPMAETNFATVATVQDLRVAAAATITLMAFRDEQVSSDGFQRTGRTHLWLTLVRVIVFIGIVCLLAFILWMAIVQRNVDKRLRWICFRFETVLLPKRPVRQRSPVLHPAY